jgi:uncharacterized membrane protein SpoIIM required for sporulation
VIIDLEKFAASERPIWQKLEALLDRLEREPMLRLKLDEAREFHYLYERASADLAKLVTFSAEPELRRYLETLVARAYSEIHETRAERNRLAPMKWFLHTLPQTFRRHAKAFGLSLAITLAGCAFGALALAFDPGAKGVIMPFEHLHGDPAERVAREEAARNDRLSGHVTTFSGQLMTHNTQVSILTLALGMTWGIGTIVSLFYNGVIVGAVALDYVRAGQTKFLLGWLMPHGVIEIPAILIAGQAGLVLANALVGWGRRERLAQRFRAVAPDLVTLIFGVGLMLIWAGLIEAFLSQYHEPIIPYVAKISFGCVELTLLVLFLGLSGRSTSMRSQSVENPIAR